VIRRWTAALRTDWHGQAAQVVSAARADLGVAKLTCEPALEIGHDQESDEHQADGFKQGTSAGRGTVADQPTARERWGDVFVKKRIGREQVWRAAVAAESAVAAAEPSLDACRRVERGGCSEHSVETKSTEQQSEPPAQQNVSVEGPEGAPCRSVG